MKTIKKALKDGNTYIKVFMVSLVPSLKLLAGLNLAMGTYKIIFAVSMVAMIFASMYFIAKRVYGYSTHVVTIVISFTGFNYYMTGLAAMDFYTAVLGVFMIWAGAYLHHKDKGKFDKKEQLTQIAISGALIAFSIFSS